MEEMQRLVERAQRERDEILEKASRAIVMKEQESEVVITALTRRLEAATKGSLVKSNLNPLLLSVAYPLPWDHAPTSLSSSPALDPRDTAQGGETSPVRSPLRGRSLSLVVSKVDDEVAAELESLQSELLTERASVEELRRQLAQAEGEREEWEKELRGREVQWETRNQQLATQVLEEMEGGDRSSAAATALLRAEAADLECQLAEATGQVAALEMARSEMAAASERLQAMVAERTVQLEDKEAAMCEALEELRLQAAADQEALEKLRLQAAADQEALEQLRLQAAADQEALEAANERRVKVELDLHSTPARQLEGAHAAAKDQHQGAAECQLATAEECARVAEAGLPHQAEGVREGAALVERLREENFELRGRAERLEAHHLNQAEAELAMAVAANAAEAVAMERDELMARLRVQEAHTHRAEALAQQHLEESKQRYAASWRAEEQREEVRERAEAAEAERDDVARQRDELAAERDDLVEKLVVLRRAGAEVADSKAGLIVAEEALAGARTDLVSHSVSRLLAASFSATLCCVPHCQLVHATMHYCFIAGCYTLLQR
jgi:hypothetical protein